MLIFIIFILADGFTLIMYVFISGPSGLMLVPHNGYSNTGKCCFFSFKSNSKPVYNDATLLSDATTFSRTILLVKVVLGINIILSPTGALK